MGNILKFRARVGINGTMVEIRIFETICKCCLRGPIESISPGSVVLCWLADPRLHGGGPHAHWSECQGKSRIMRVKVEPDNTRVIPRDHRLLLLYQNCVQMQRWREGHRSVVFFLWLIRTTWLCGCQDVCFRKVLRISSNYLSSASLIVRYAENHKIQYKSWTLLKATD